MEAVGNSSNLVWFYSRQTESIAKTSRELHTVRRLLQQHIKRVMAAITFFYRVTIRITAGHCRMFYSRIFISVLTQTNTDEILFK